MDFVFAADVDTAKTDKTSFPDFPGENPSQADMLKWLDAWHDDLVTSGFSAHLRGELPFELAKLKPRELLPVPSDATAAISVNIQNASITHPGSALVSKMQVHWNAPCSLLLRWL